MHVCMYIYIYIYMHAYMWRARSHERNEMISQFESCEYTHHAWGLMGAQRLQSANAVYDNEAWSPSPDALTAVSQL